MARSLNKAILIGNLTRDPELRYTPQGSAVCSFGLATNRQWTTDSGEKKEDVEFHRIVAWNKLAEICSQLLRKGRKVYLEGRLQTRSWAGQDGVQKTTTEVVISDMIILDPKRDETAVSGEGFDIPDSALAEAGSGSPQSPAAPSAAVPGSKSDDKKKPTKKKADEESKSDEEDIPF